MKKSWTITEKVIATLLQAWAVYFVYSLTNGISDRLHFVTKVQMDYGLIISMFHMSYIIGILTFVAGVALLYDKKWGWLSCIICTILFAGFMLVSGRNGIQKENNVMLMASVGYFITAALFIILLFLLVQKPFRQKYKPTILNWLIVGASVLLVLIDKSIF